MSEASVRLGEAGELRLAGVLDYRTGPALREAGRKLIASAGASGLRIDCGEVEKSSSVGISLLLAFLRDVGEQDGEARIANLPQDMREIARVTGLLDLLPLEG
ncbi:STAS domain-containing protein [Stutzerimonas tarimensis]|uniref:Lipid asymmetry maintenance protein MlaB n=1 Tax=Stutzerimonas tarimensis TaxID=1507735 RepID=A0ABV7T5T4_9GAMM